MTSTGVEIRSVHASFGSVHELSDRRRALYRLALETASRRSAGDGSPTSAPVADPTPDVLDNPVVRGHLGAVLGGVAEYDPDRVRSIREWADVLEVDSGPEYRVHLAARRGAVPALGPALIRIGVGPGAVEPGTLLLTGSEAFEPTRQRLADGVRLALDVAPELVGDLLPHVALLAVVPAAVAGRLGSASLREYPGLIVLPEPRSALEVAEALVHEGAHVKFFDLAMTCSLLATGGADRFRPPWASPDAAAWPFEQTVAAFHAYCCLAAFHEALVAQGDPDLHAHSLLPLAAERADVIGRFLLDRGGHLGPDGQEFVGRLAGRDFGTPAARTDATELIRRARRDESSVLSRDCGDWTLLMQWTEPVTMAWVPSSQLT